jgi:hypothetical protein
MITGLGTEVLEAKSLHVTGVNHQSAWGLLEKDTLLKIGDVLTLSGADSMVRAEIRAVHDSQVRVSNILQLGVIEWLRSTSAASEEVQVTDDNMIIHGGIAAGVIDGNVSPGDNALAIGAQVLGTSKQEPGAGPVTSNEETTSRKPSAPQGKVKASFNLLYGDVESLRAMAKRLGTTVTSVLQRAIRDESFLQEQLREGNKFAIIDKEGTVREIIWR